MQTTAPLSNGLRVGSEQEVLDMDYVNWAITAVGLTAGYFAFKFLVGDEITNLISREA